MTALAASLHRASSALNMSRRDVGAPNEITRSNGKRLEPASLDCRDEPRCGGQTPPRPTAPAPITNLTL